MPEQQSLHAIPPPPPAPLAFSISKVNQYLKCPAAYYFRYVMNVRTPPRSYQAFGTALHAGIAHNYRRKIESQMDLPISEVKEFFSADFDFQKGNVLWEKGEDPGRLKDEGTALLDIYQTQVAPKIQPEIVEDLFELKFENTDYVFKGIIDLVDKSSGMIIDHKTTSKTPQASTIEKDLQLTAYALGNRVRTGVIENGLAFDYLVRGKSPKTMRLTTTRSDEDIERFLRLLAHVTAAIKEQRFYPNPTHPYCSQKLCGFWDMCQGGRKW